MLRVTRVSTSRGALGVLEWGIDGPVVVLLHPNGFCAGLYEPVAELLRADAHVIAIDLPGHGASTTPDDRADLDFEVMAARVLEALDALGVRSAAVAGGSLGGAVAVLADKLDPGRWTRAVLAEAVAFPTDGLTEEVRGGAEGPRRDGNGMAEQARRRRPGFADEAAMVESLSKRPPVSELAPEALAAYARWGTVASADGIRLACTPETEATIFEVSAERGGAQAAWDHLPHLSCPATILAGRRSFLPDVFTEQAHRASAGIEFVDGGHFVLHEDSARGADLIRRHALAIDADAASPNITYGDHRYA